MEYKSIESYFYPNLNKRQIKTKKAIYESFIKLAQEKDISKITVSAISSQAHIDRKTFYIYFSSAQDVYNEIISIMEVVIEVIVNQHIEDGFKLHPVNLFRTINKLILDNIEICTEAAKNGTFREFIDMTGDVFYRELVKIYSDPFKENSDEIKLVADFISAGTVSAYLKWLRGETDISIDSVARLCGDIIIHGVAGIAEQIL